MVPSELVALVLGCASVLFAPPIYASEPFGQAERAEEKTFVERVETANVLGLSLAYQAPLSIEKDVPLGIGLSYTRDYFVSKRTALGIVGAVRFFPDAPFHFAFGYGLSFKHYIGVGETFGKRSGLYFRYGLLMQMNVLEGQSGSPTGHDTHMALGYDWRAGRVVPVVEVGYHLTQVRAFEQDTLWWPFTEVLIGLRF